jgi:putative transposase
MGTSYTALEISKITGFGKLKILRRSEREKWKFRKEAVRGGTAKRFFFGDLPDDIQLLIRKQELKQSQEIVPKPQSTGTDLAKKNMEDVGMAKADLLRHYKRHMHEAPWGRKAAHRELFMDAYNSGQSYPNLYRALGPLSWKTIEGWKVTLDRNGWDAAALVDRRGKSNGSRVIDQEQMEILLGAALRPNAPKIAEIIRISKYAMKTRGIDCQISDATCRRWLTNWKRKNFGVWVFKRHGETAWNDEVAFYVERDINILDVGDMIVADGHKLNFEVINPWTGKPCRPIMVLWFDMKSSFPLGWELMPTENTASISSALRRSILRLGKYPKIAYMDNGKAFRAKFFTNCPDFEESGFYGLYSRLGINTIFAWPYHGQSKTIERFFGAFGELERMAPTYVGTSINTQPPRMRRGEKIHKAVYDKAYGNGITMEQAHSAIATWFDMYADRPAAGHLNGARPADVFNAGKGPGVDPVELRFLMMAKGIKKIYRNGIHIFGQNYYASELYGYRLPVEIRYDLQDRSSILVFDQSGRFMCEAYPVEKAHPAASVLGTDEDREHLKRLIEMKRRQRKEATASAREFLEDEILPEYQKQIGIEPGSDNADQSDDNPSDALQIDYDPEKIYAEVRELEACRIDPDEDTEEDTDGEIINHPTRDQMLRDTIGRLSEMDRYENLLELEAEGEQLPEDLLAFMRYYEMSEEYERYRTYWDEKKIKLALLYQSAGTGESEDD